MEQTLPYLVAMLVGKPRKLLTCLSTPSNSHSSHTRQWKISVPGARVNEVAAQGSDF
jgi:hypothetical protein